MTNKLELIERLKDSLQVDHDVRIEHPEYKHHLGLELFFRWLLGGGGLEP